MRSSRYTIASIDVGEVLGYLGRTDQEVSDDLRGRVEDMAGRCMQIARPMGVTRVFDVVPAEADAACPAEPQIGLAGSALVLRGRDICAHLDGARAVGLMAVTLGAQVDLELRRLAHLSPLDQVIFDACATTLVERAADAAEAELVAAAHARGLFLNWRYSPGYGDFDVDVQPQLLRTLDAQRAIGLAVTPSCLLVPTKSVTAVAGMFATPQPGRGTLCDKCHCYEFCTIRTTGRTCRG